MNPLTLLGKTLEDLPVYALNYMIALLLAILSDTIVTSLAIGCAILGVATTSVLIAFAAFFLAYVLIRTVNSVANAIGHTGMGLIETLRNTSPPVVMTDKTPVSEGVPLP